MDALTAFEQIATRHGGEFIPVEVIAPSYDLLCKYDDLLDTAQAIRGELAVHGLKPRLRQQTARFAFVAKMLLPASCSKYFTTLANLKTDWPANWKNHIDLSAHIEGVMRAVRDELEGVTA